MSIEERLDRIEHLVISFINMQSKKDSYSEWDTDSIKKTSNAQKDDIINNRTAIEESFEASLENSDDISDLRTAIEEVYELITEE